MTARSAAPVPFRPMLVIGGGFAVLIAATLGLWAWYGTTLFFEVLRAGWNACF